MSTKDREIDLNTLPAALRKIAKTTHLQFHGKSWGNIIYSARSQSKKGRILYIMHNPTLSAFDYINIYQGVSITRNNFTDTYRTITSSQMYTREYVLNRLFALCCCDVTNKADNTFTWHFYEGLVDYDDKSREAYLGDEIVFDFDVNQSRISLETPQGNFIGRVNAYNSRDTLPNINWQVK